MDATLLSANRTRAFCAKLPLPTLRNLKTCLLRKFPAVRSATLATRNVWKFVVNRERRALARRSVPETCLEETARLVNVCLSEF